MKYKMTITATMKGRRGINPVIMDGTFVAAAEVELDWVPIEPGWELAGSLPSVQHWEFIDEHGGSVAWFPYILMRDD